MMVPLQLSELPVVFISYDEPNADRNFALLQAEVPGALRVHGVKGFDAAHRQAGTIAHAPHVITVDGDNRPIEPGFFQRRIELLPADLSAVISFSALLPHNGLVYGNGGVKIWPRPLLQTLRTHEAARNGGLNVDFAWRIPYVQARGVPSESVVTGSSYQAFRAGFREGVRLCMERGRLASENYPDMAPGEALRKHLPAPVLDRLRIWCSVGRDTENGAYAILGARMGCVMVMLDGFDAQNIADFDWLAHFWQTNVQPSIAGKGCIDAEIARYGDRIKTELGLLIDDLPAQASAFVKSFDRSSRRLGTLMPQTYGRPAQQQ